jgi:hypothetical protein
MNCACQVLTQTIFNSCGRKNAPKGEPMGAKGGDHMKQLQLRGATHNDYA